jgi:hypothetical protein
LIYYSNFAVNKGVLFANAKAEMIPELIEIKSMRPDVDNATVGIIQHLYLSSSCE